MGNNIFAQRVKELRLKAHLSQSVLGSYIGISMQTVNDIENARVLANSLQDENP